MYLLCASWQIYTYQRPALIDKSDNGPHEANYLKLDCAKYKKTFSWKPVWHIDKAVDKTAEWYSAYAAGENVKAVMEEQLNEFAEDMEK